MCRLLKEPAAIPDFNIVLGVAIRLLDVSDLGDPMSVIPGTHLFIRTWAYERLLARLHFQYFPILILFQLVQDPS
jgi:hypothetical protein